MMFSIALAGTLSSLAVGPASFTIIRQMLADKKWPWQEIAGFLVADLIYIILSLALLQSSWMQIPGLQMVLTLLTCTTLIGFSIKLLLKAKDGKTAISDRKGFQGTLLLTLGNFHMPIIYTGLFGAILDGSSLQMILGAGLYALSFSGGFLLLLATLQSFQGPFQKLLRQIEVVAGSGFILFSFYLLRGIL